MLNSSTLTVTCTANQDINTSPLVFFRRERIPMEMENNIYGKEIENNNILLQYERSICTQANYIFRARSNSLK